MHWILLENYSVLESLSKPIALIKATHNGREALNASTDEVQGLHIELRVRVGARVILRRNLWDIKGIDNGSVGTITDIIYDLDVEYKVYNDRMPLCLLREFKKYLGPTLFDRWVPILPITSSSIVQSPSERLLNIHHHGCPYGNIQTGTK